MRVAMIGQKGMPAVYGGIERHVEELSKRLANNGLEVLVYTRPNYSDPRRGVCDGVALKSLPSIHTKHLDAISHTFLATFHALKWNPDLYHYHGVGPSLLAFLPRIFRPHAKVIITFHCRDCEHQKWGWFARRVLRFGEWCATHFPHQTITVSKELKFYIGERFHREVVYIPNGGKIEERVQPSFIKSNFGLNEGSYFLTVTRLVRHKGIHHVIRAYQGLDTTKKLVIVGDATFTDSYVEELKRLRGGNPNILFTGWQSGKNLAEFYSNAYLFVQASENEGMPISVLEAMAYGTPILVSDIPSNREFSQGCGLTFKNRSVVDLRRAMEQAILDPVSMRELGKLGRKRLLQEYHWDRIAEATGQLYDSLCDPSVLPASRVVS